MEEHTGHSQSNVASSTAETDVVPRRRPLDRLLAFGVAGVVLGVVVGAVIQRSAEPPRRETGPTMTVTSRPAAEPIGRALPDSAPPPTPVESEVAASPSAPALAAAVPGAAPLDEPSIAEDDSPSALIADDGAPVAAVEPPIDGATDPVAGLSPALDAAIDADKWFKALRKNLHGQLGTGALATAQGLTPAGRRVLERVRRLDADAVTPLGYGVEALEQRLATWSSVDASGVAALEAQLGRALVRLVFDYRILRTTGPFKLVGETDVGKDLALQKETRELALAYIRTPDAAAAEAILDPPHPSWVPLRAAFARYKALVAAGGCKPLKPRALKPGAKGEAVEALQERLRCEGYYQGESDGIYDEDVRAAVALFQRHHELTDLGNVFGETLTSLNVPVQRRLEQLELAIKRLRETRVRDLGTRYLKVNIPAYELVGVEDNQIVKRVKVIVGTNRLDDDKVQLIQGHINRTKLLVSRLYEVLVNPTWILPERVAKGELVGKVEQDPEYLKKLGIGTRTLPDGRQVFVQGQGRDNVLGKVKFLLEKTNAVYLHDTDKPWLFREERRAFSHGCMRVHEAVGFARWILLRDGYPPAEVERNLALGKMQKAMPLRKPWEFMTEYITVDFTEEGLPKFLTDAYGYDKAYEKGALPPYTQTRWGSKILRPRWVPEASDAAVDEWRKNGQQAPRDPKWKPEKAPEKVPEDAPGAAPSFDPDDRPAGKPTKPTPPRRPRRPRGQP